MAGNYDVGISIKALDEFSSTFNSLQKQLGSIQTGVEKTSAKFSQFGSKMRNIGRSLSMRLTAPIMAGAGYAFKQVMDFDEINEQLFKTTGSLAKAKIAFESVRKIATTTGWNPEEIASIETRFMGLGNSAEEAAKKTDIYAKAALGSGHSISELSNIMIRAEIMSAKAGKGHGMFPLRSATQLLKAIPAVGVELKKMGIISGTSAEIIAKAFGQSKISVNSVNEALGRIAANTHGLSIEQNMKRIHNIFRYFIFDAAEAVFGTNDIKEATDKLGDKLNHLGVQFGAFAKAHPTLIKIAAGFLAIVAIVGPLCILIGAILSPIGLIAIGIGIAIAAVIYLYNKFSLVRDCVSGIANIFKMDWEILKFIGRTMEELYESAKKFVNMMAHPFGGGEAANQSQTQMPSLLGGGFSMMAAKLHKSQDVNVNVKVDQDGRVKDVKTQGANQKTNLNTAPYMALSRH